MRTKYGWAGIRNTLAALGLAACTAATADASSLLTYDTVGSTIGTTGVTRHAARHVHAGDGGSFQSPSNLSFGKFQVRPRPTGHDDLHEHAVLHHVHGRRPQREPDPRPERDPGHDHRRAQRRRCRARASRAGGDVRPAQSTFKTGLYQHTLSLPDSPLRLTPSTSSGLTTAQAHLSSSVGHRAGARAVDDRPVRRHPRRPRRPPPGVLRRRNAATV